MPVTIHKRATWSEYVDAMHRVHAASDPVPSVNPWNPTVGVFIHHRGPAPLGGGDYVTEEDCLEDIANVYMDHVQGDEFNGDVAYNFFICQHGNIYEGRGYERGEANSPGYVGEIGRNTGFYSICALMQTNHTANEPLLRAFRALIQHLRTEAPRRTGLRILPHSFENPSTVCPGNMLMYAKEGSTIDPAAPWIGVGDLHVYKAQHWVNATYAGVAPGYVWCSENGRTGWSTVLSFTQGLQHELGISPTVQSFGPGTFNAVKARNKLPNQETNGNLIRLYNGALFAKGYWASVDQGQWTGDSQEALETLYGHAGLSYADATMRQKMWPHIVKALMRMDQFRLVPGADPEIQKIQRRLNVRYVAGVGIPAMSLVPCEGIYSRDVQQGLMMGLQYELGLDINAINGNFGPGTQAGLRGRGSGTLTGDLRYIFRSACYFNSPTYVREGNIYTPLSYLASDIGSDFGSGTHIDWVRAFQDFSQIPITGTNDYTTWAQLLVSSGDTTRPATGCDCITEITAARGAQLYAAGYRIVGRYLDEHVPPGDPTYLGKALKPGEPRTILDAGLRFFPLFQYNGRQLANFTFDKGYDQGKKAHLKAVEHGIPPGTCIYFGVDYDAMDADIDSNVKPYFEGVRVGLAELGNRYTFGTYGSRNVCSRIAEEVGARWSLVSGMSWGFSGNLGFPMPENWAFNQIREFTFQPGWGLDHDVWRQGADPGVSTLVTA
jgi:peptidoglycan hydrolase-like protein with peptidoglycan-binding domain